MTTQKTNSLTIQVAIDELYWFLLQEPAFADTLVELLEKETFQALTDQLVAILEMIDAFLAQLQSLTVSLDGAFSFLEVAAETIDFVTGELKEMTLKATDSSQQFLQGIGELFSAVPETDMSGVTNLSRLLPNPQELASIRASLRQLIGREQPVGILMAPP